MDNRLILTVLFVTLSWISVGTYAQATNITTEPTNNMTSAPNATMATNLTAPAAGNNTAGNNTTAAPAAGNNTAGNNTTAAPAAGNNTTAAPAAGNNTAGNNTTAAPAAGNNTAGNNTTAAGNNTAGNNTTTTAPPLTPNATVEALVTNISRTECGSKQLCASQPSSCDPASGSCFFLGAKQLSGDNFEFALAGQSEGYIAATLATGALGNNDTTYVCANNKGVVKFFGTVLSGTKLIKKVLNANSVKGKVNGKTIQCTFAATVPNPVTKASALTVAISSGSFNSTSEDLGDPVVTFKSPPVDLGNPNATVTNALSGHATMLQKSLTQALLITVGVLGLAIL